MFPDLPILSPCANGSHEFFSAIENCLSNVPAFELPKLMKDIENLNRSLVIQKPSYIRIKNTYYVLEENVWSRTFHETFGPCHRMDLDKSALYKSAQIGDHVYVGFSFVKNVSWALTRIFLHSTNNFPDSAAINPNYFIFSSQMEKSEWLDFKLTKVNISREQTREMPCQPYHKQTCEEINAIQRIVTELKCQVPFVITGNHLDHLNITSLPLCDNVKARLALQIFKETKCKEGLVSKILFHALSHG